MRNKQFSLLRSKCRALEITLTNKENEINSLKEKNVLQEQMINSLKERFQKSTKELKEENRLQLDSVNFSLTVIRENLNEKIKETINQVKSIADVVSNWD